MKYIIINHNRINRYEYTIHLEYKNNVLTSSNTNWPISSNTH